MGFVWRLEQALADPKGGRAIWPWPPHYDFREGPAPQAAEEIVKGGEGKKKMGGERKGRERRKGREGMWPP